MTQFPSPGPEAQGDEPEGTHAQSSSHGSETQAAPATSGTSPADADHEGGTAAPSGQTIAGIGDDQLPEDLQPTDDNPLAQPLDPDDENTKSRDELGMDDTQEDLGNGDASADDAETGGGANSGEGAQGAGLAEG